MGLFEEKCFLTKKYRVILANGLPPNSKPMRAHVFSGDDELGYHTLNRFQNFTFSFCAGFKTEFFCHLWWDKKDAQFDLFKTEKYVFARCEDECYWLVRGDGIYYSPSYRNQPPHKVITW
ncbi:S-protein homolog 8-like [Primulina eburnea]|uniref:S-protein homolog 8-like n=1 Tax=Primulina eburnea TaxID=1245227 RepID=UPI003C6BEDFD